MNKLIFLYILFISSLSFGQREEATITRTFGTNSVYPRQFPSMTVRKMNENEYWLYDSLNTNTIFHRIFPTYIVRKQNTYTSSQQWGVYRTTGTNSVYPQQFPDRYISDLNWRNNKNVTENQYPKNNNIRNESISIKNISTENESISAATYTRALRSDKKAAYAPESPE